MFRIENTGLSLLEHEAPMSVNVQDPPHSGKPRGDAAGRYAIVLACLLILVVSAFAPFNIRGDPDSMTDSSSDGVGVQASVTAPDSTVALSQHDWDWTKYSDENGYIDVVVSVPGDSSSNPLAAMMHRIDVSSQSGSPLGGPNIDPKGLVAELSRGCRMQFRQGFSGFSAHLSIDVVKNLTQVDPAVTIFPDFQFRALAPDNVLQVGADQLWSRTDNNGCQVKGRGVIVAIIDTGVDYTHPDLGGGFGSSYKVTGGYDFYNSDSDPMDDNGHGTHVAGIVAANGITFQGVAPDASILAYKVLGADGTGSMSDVIAAIERATDPNNDGSTSDHADIISMSLGGDGTDGDPLSIAVKSAVDAGVVVVAAAGNSGPSMGTVESPGRIPEVITVGAVDSGGKLASFSSRCTKSRDVMKPEISAPGVNIVSCVPYSNGELSSPTGYRSLSGTSMATPHVSGAAALLLQLHPTWTPEQMKSSLVAGSKDIGESLWLAGAGQLWVPSAADVSLFANPAIISYGFAGGSGQDLLVSNTGASSTFAVNTADEISLYANETRGSGPLTGLSAANPTSITLSSGSTGSVVLVVGVPSPDATQGYYEGRVEIRDGNGGIQIPFGFTVLSRLEVHVFDPSGYEVLDPYGGVWVYSIPDAETTMQVLGSSTTNSPPANFMLPSGNYSIHAAGYPHLYYHLESYFLSDVVQLNSLETRVVNLRMSSARQMTLDLATDDGLPIYVKDYRVYCRFVGENNVSFHITGSDYSVTGTEILSLPTSKTIYVSDTNATVGISVAGFSYSTSMWDFMSRNSQHWYEFFGGTSTGFYAESTADLQYLLSWEFNGIGPSTPLLLGLTEGQYSIYDTKYDIPGPIDNTWDNWGTHTSMGNDGTFYMRRSTDTSINPLYSGMTRRTIVQGVFSEQYFPNELYDGYFEQEYYIPDYNHTLKVTSLPGVSIPDRNFLQPVSGLSSVERVGTGPFYPAVRTSNTNSALVLYHPLLRDQASAKVGLMHIPKMLLYRDNSVIGIYDLEEYTSRPDAKRTVALTGIGLYRAEISCQPSPTICSYANITLGFRVPYSDVNPPQITGISMPQRFIPGQTIDLVVSASDDTNITSVEISWRPDGVSAWRILPVNRISAVDYGASIQTSASDGAVWLKTKVTDYFGNYIEYSASTVSQKEIPVLLEIAANPTEVYYQNSDACVVLTGSLTDATGEPLGRTASVPLELILNGKKIGLILDDYVASQSHIHDGNIRFEWHFNPYDVFSGPDQTVDIRIAFDLGIYEPISETITLRSVMSSNSPPTITLESPTNGSLIASGQIIDLNIVDDGTFTASAYLDGVALSSFVSPWQISTSSWSDGRHTLGVTAIDDQLCFSSASYEFEIDALAPSVAITFPLDGAKVPLNSILTASVNDERLSSVAYSADSKPAVPMQAPYSIDMSGWTPGQHMVTITATDMVGHLTAKRVAFEISSSSVALQLLTPANRSVICSGTPIQFTASGNGSMTYKWSEGGTWTDLGTQMTISTVGWLQGLHTLLINATSSLGGWDQITVALTIDDVVPVIQLQSPSNNSYVSPTDRISIHVQENNLMTVTWTLWGSTWSGSSPDLSISLSSYPGDGVFSITVRATDKAGNEARGDFVFKLDSSPPMLSIANLVSGEVARLGLILNVSASDPYLTQVEWSLDDGQRTLLASPYDINTSSFSVGWHSLQITASDASGKQTVLTVSFYLDNTAPEIGSISSTSFKSGTDFSVTANVTDDYGVGSVLLYYELANGSYASLPMAFDGGSYVVLLPAYVLWDGMEVYVSCMDVAGNSVLGPHVKLNATFSAPAPSSGPKSLVGFFSSISGIALLGAIAMISSMSLFLMSRRRSRDEETPPKPSVARAIPPETPRVASTVSALPAAKARQPSRTLGQVQIARVDAAAGLIAQARSAAPPLESRKPTRPPTLIDSIPEMVAKSQLPRDEPEPETDYGEMIERELIIPSLRTSIFRENIKDLNSEIVQQLEELGAMCKQTPKKTLG